MDRQDPNANVTTEGAVQVKPSEVTPTLPAGVETVEGLKAQLARLNQTHMATIEKFKALEAQRADLGGITQRLAAIESSIAQDKAERSAVQLQAMLEAGDEDGAKRIAASQIKQRVGRLGIDLASDPRLRGVRVDDPIEGWKTLNALEPFLTVEEKRSPESKPAETQPVVQPSDGQSVDNIPQEMREKLEQEFMQKHGLLKTVTSGVTGGGANINDLSPIEQIKIGMQGHREGK